MLNWVYEVRFALGTVADLIILVGLPVLIFKTFQKKEDVRIPDIVIGKKANFCGQCGSPLRPEQIVCLKCGKKIR